MMANCTPENWIPQRRADYNSRSRFRRRVGLVQFPQPTRPSAADPPLCLTLPAIYSSIANMIPGLDGLRATAFLLVFAFHMDYLRVGWTGVSLFFVLSGFLITGILLEMKKRFAPKDFFIKFYGRRCLRIFPVYYFYLLLMTGVTAWLITRAYQPELMQVFQDQVGYAALYVYNFFFATTAFRDNSFLAHFWSLSVEEQFYIYWPLLIFLTPEKYVKALCLAFIFLGPVFRIVFYLFHSSGAAPFLAVSPGVAVYPLPFSHVDAFALGAFISRHPIRWARLQFFALAGLIPAIGFTAQYLATGYVGSLSAFGFPMFLTHGYQFLWGYSVLNYFFAVLIYGVAREGWARAILEWAPMRYLGRISYGLYVYHYPLIWFVGRIGDLGVNPSYLKPLTALLAFCASLAMASASYFLLERPALNLKDRFFRVAAPKEQRGY